MACRLVCGLSAALAVLLAVHASAEEEPRRCCWIDQMTGLFVVQQNQELADGTIVIESTGAEFAYDKTFAANAFIFREIFENGTQHVGRFVDFYAWGVSYYIEDNQGEQTCRWRRIPAHFQPNCVPAKSEFVSNVTLGDHALTGNNWVLNTFADDRLFNGSFLVASDYCVPIANDYVAYDFNHDPPEVNLVTVAYADIQLGICERDKFFHIPDTCRQDASVTSHMEAKRKQLRMMEAPFRLDTFM